ncbi:MAG: TetR family transcriptional regulator [Alphaproteobacteria bacterium]|nr:TetR family transcriptional regulator [Alphaproteobacteria bacterium]
MKSSVRRNATAPVGRGRRAENHERTRRRLFESALSVVGEHGYSGATIAKITRHAEVAQGTFYNYFDSQADLYEQLLPYLGDQLIARLDEAVTGAEDQYSREQRCLATFFDFMRLKPEFYSILKEAEVVVPQAYRSYLTRLVTWYQTQLQKDWDEGRLGGYEPRDFEILAYSIIAAHHYLATRFTKWVDSASPLPQWVGETFTAFVARGLGSGLPPGSAAQTAPPTDLDSEDSVLTPEASPPASSETRVPGATLAFRPQLSAPRPYLSNAAFFSQINCRTEVLSPNRTMVELDLTPELLNSKGTAGGGLITSLAEMAGTAAVCHDRDEVLSVITLGFSSTLIRQVSSGKVVAVATRENAGRNVRFVSVDILKDSPDGELIAKVTGTFRVLGD